MSLELYLRPKTGELDFSSVEKYFDSNSLYSRHPEGFIYENPETNVYFSLSFSSNSDFETQDLDKSVSNEQPYHLVLNINYLRPGFFIDEINIEILTLINMFDLDCSIDGGDRKEYDFSELFAYVENVNRTFATKILMDDERKFPFPRSQSYQIWKYQYFRKNLDEQIKEDFYVSRYYLLEIDDEIVVSVFWPDAIPCVFPRAEKFLIMRDKLASKGFFRQTPDWVVVDFEDIIAEITPYVTEFHSGLWKFNSPVTDKCVFEYVKKIKPQPKKPKLLRFDDIYDAEWIDN